MRPAHRYLAAGAALALALLGDAPGLAQGQGDWPSEWPSECQDVGSYASVDAPRRGGSSGVIATMPRSLCADLPNMRPRTELPSLQIDLGAPGQGPAEPPQDNRDNGRPWRR
jgi:hypothetical protein